MKTFRLCVEALFCGVQINGLFLLLYFLLSRLLRSLGADAEESGVSASHAQVGESLEFLLLLSDHAGLLLLVHLEQKLKKDSQTLYYIRYDGFIQLEIIYLRS